MFTDGVSVKADAFDYAQHVKSACSPAADGGGLPKALQSGVPVRLSDCGITAAHAFLVALHSVFQYVLDYAPCWMRYNVPGGTSQVGNPRRAYVQFEEA